MLIKDIQLHIINNYSSIKERESMTWLETKMCILKFRKKLGIYIEVSDQLLREQMWVKNLKYLLYREFERKNQVISQDLKEKLDSADFFQEINSIYESLDRGITKSMFISYRFIFRMRENSFGTTIVRSLLFYSGRVDNNLSPRKFVESLISESNLQIHLNAVSDTKKINTFNHFRSHIYLFLGVMNSIGLLEPFDDYIN